MQEVGAHEWLGTILKEAGGVVLDSEGNDYDIYSGRPIIMSRSMKVAQELVALFES